MDVCNCHCQNTAHHNSTEDCHGYSYEKWLTRAIMNCKGTNWLKKEKNEVYAESGSLFLEDDLEISQPNDFIKEDPELNLDVDETENTFLEEDLEISLPNDFIKEDPELNLELDEPENTVSTHISDFLHVV
ncbi:uncharacterized protein LOC124720232 [Schistocerca piceifrons]|uniref:uncharacterized protein LOC124720232 n=1 Tax=Schistocerca piceifrons TaxID=274613 RepID=UPI001F5F64A9|nr:uncharacterized protein LOC124720232 [Schistocerca piceifrons]